MRAVRALLVVCGVVLGLAPPALADGPGLGTPTVVTLGDSAISGEAGRWAGNTNAGSWRVDALGPSAYDDVPGGESTPSCHRSRSAEAFIGDGFATANLSCSGARTSTHFRWDGAFKPGLDFYADGAGREGQALALQHFAATHDVRAVVVLIGANDYDFAGVMRTCVLDWLGSTRWNPRYCSEDAGVRATFSQPNIGTQAARIEGALRNVHQAMVNAGYADDRYTMLVQTYPSVIPRAAGIRYPQTGLTRQSVGGCGMWDRDADWANDRVVPVLNATIRDAVAASGLTNAAILDMTDALAGRRLCERGVGLLEEQRARFVGRSRRRRPDRVGQPGAHGDDRRRLPAPGGRAPELLGPARLPQLPAPGVRERRAARRQVHDRRTRADGPWGARDAAALTRLPRSVALRAGEGHPDGAPARRARSGATSGDSPLRPRALAGLG